MTTPLISIVMPVYNAMPYLEQAIASILAQTVSDWELVAVDDASTDGSWEYLSSVQDSRLILLRNDKNMKQSFTQNRGIDVARGKYVARMDADDLSVPVRLERQLEALEADSGIDVLGSGMFLVTKQMDLIAVRRPPTMHREICRWAALDFPLTHGAMMGKREWFCRWRADPSIRLAQDFELLFRAHRQSVFANVAEPLYIYRLGGVTGTFRQKCALAYYNCKGLVKNGFRMKMPFTTLFGLASNLPRPLLYAVKSCLKIKRGVTPGWHVAGEDAASFEESLRQIGRTAVPASHGSMCNER